ncbi:IclR family transcriptional regulator [Cupriavidus sp. UYMMa02A]|nr:IclR family transcriptional regulator [Cupriavidus sp. UYMMa02A]
MAPPSSTPAGVQSLERVFSILALLADHHVIGMSLRQLVELTGLSRATAQRMIAFLLQLHYVEQDPKTRNFRLGTAAMFLGLRTMSRPPLVQLPPYHYCVPLARRSGEGVFLVIGIGDYSYNLHLEQVPPQNPDLMSLVGQTRLLGLGIGSLSLLSTMTNAEIRQHHERHAAEYHSHGLTIARILTGVERSRQLGYTLAAGFGVAGVGHAFAVPSGFAAISMVFPTRMPLSRRHELGSLIVEEVNSQATS